MKTGNCGNEGENQRGRERRTHQAREEGRERGRAWLTQFASLCHMVLFYKRSQESRCYGALVTRQPWKTFLFHISSAPTLHLLPPIPPSQSFLRLPILFSLPFPLSQNFLLLRFLPLAFSNPGESKQASGRMENYVSCPSVTLHNGSVLIKLNIFCIDALQRHIKQSRVCSCRCALCCDSNRSSSSLACSCYVSVVTSQPSSVFWSVNYKNTFLYIY